MSYNTTSRARSRLPSAECSQTCAKLMALPEAVDCVLPSKGHVSDTKYRCGSPAFFHSHCEVDRNLTYQVSDSRDAVQCVNIQLRIAEKANSARQKTSRYIPFGSSLVLKMEFRIPHQGLWKAAEICGSCPASKPGN